MTEYDFIIQYHKGADMPSDYLSRNVLASIDVFSEDIPMLQHNDEFARSVFQFLQDGSLSADGQLTSRKLGLPVSLSMDNFGEGCKDMACLPKQSWSSLGHWSRN